jgi:hypothetical protein
LFTVNILRASFCIIAASAGELSERAFIAADRSLRIELIERREENSSLLIMLGRKRKIQSKN